MTYDELDRVVRQYDDISKNSTNYTYDSLGNLTLETTFKSTVQYTYNQLNQLTAKTDAEGTTRYTYDAANRQWMSSDPVKDGLNWYQYCLSNPVTFVDPTGLAVNDYFGLLSCGDQASYIALYGNDDWWELAGSDEYWYNRAVQAEQQYDQIQKTFTLAGGPGWYLNHFLVKKMDSAHLKTAERIEVYGDMFSAAKFYFNDYAGTAAAMKETMFEETYGPGSPWLNYDGAKPNAFQHVYWNALMAHATDKKTAEIFATAHEVLSSQEYENGALGMIANEGVAPPDPGIVDNYTLRDHVYMDMHNNEVGREIGSKIPSNPIDIHNELIEIGYKGDIESYRKDTRDKGAYVGYSDTEILIMYYTMQTLSNSDAVWLVE